MKITRRTKLLVVALALCFTTMIGSTFAWFTDTVEVNGNNIQAGTLDVTMEYAKGTEDPANATWIDASTGTLFNYKLWEPGYVEVYHVKIANAGTLALKYDLKLVADGTVSKLAEVIDVYYADPASQATSRELTGMNKISTLQEFIAQNADNATNTASGNLQAGQSHTVTLALKMREEAGNEYQGMAIGSSFNLVLNATQMMSEEDSFGNDYDADARFPGDPIKVMNADDLEKAIAEGGNIVLGSDIAVNRMIEIPANGSASIDGQDYTLTRADSYTGTILSLGEYAELTLSNITLDGENVESTGNLIYIDSFGKLILNDGTVLEKHVGGTTYDSARGPENSVIHCDGATTIVMNDGSVIRNNVGKGNFATVIASMYDLTCELNGGKIINNTSEKNNYTVNFGNYANITVSDGFEASGNTDGGLMRVNQQSTFTMDGGKLDGNGKAVVYTWVAKYVTLDGGEIIGNVYLNYAPATVGGTDVDGRIQKDKEVTKWALNLTPDFGTVRYYIEGNITQLSIVPAEGYTYVTGDESKLICENTGYETYWDAESGCFKVQASE